jgi:hypothetical protein
MADRRSWDLEGSLSADGMMRLCEVLERKAGMHRRPIPGATGPPHGTAAAVAATLPSGGAAGGAATSDISGAATRLLPGIAADHPLAVEACTWQDAFAAVAALQSRVIAELHVIVEHEAAELLLVRNAALLHDGARLRRAEVERAVSGGRSWLRLVCRAIRRIDLCCVRCCRCRACRRPLTGSERWI